MTTVLPSHLYRFPSSLTLTFSLHPLPPSLHAPPHADEEGILNTYASLSELLDYEIAKVGSPDRVLMGGFSQGGACSMFAGHKYPQKLGGLIVTSGYLLLGEDAKKVSPCFL